MSEEKGCVSTRKGGGGEALNTDWDRGWFLRGSAFERSLDCCLGVHYAGGGGGGKPEHSRQKQSSVV